MTTEPTPGANVAESLTLAIVSASNAPILLLDSDLIIIAASASFSRSYGIDPAHIRGRHVLELGTGEWAVRQMGTLLRAAANGSANIDSYEMDLEQPGRPTRRLSIQAQKLEYGDMNDVRLLMTVVDLTESRLADKLRTDLLREREDLLQELQRRIANSLQIIASVLMLSAKRVSSADTRRHLVDARNRVLSMATLQENLAASRGGEVELRTYFNDLCKSLAASMIDNDNQPMTLVVTADDSRASPDVSVSLGLIVTELVINALKHAIPDGRSGNIGVDYRSITGDWTLGVSDDGIGMPRDRSTIKAGLGTSIVQALAKQLDARIAHSDRNPGSRVEISHYRVAAANILVDSGA